jgi:hypothetical protein
MHVISANGGIKGGASGLSIFTIGANGIPKITGIGACVGRNAPQNILGGAQRQILYDTLVYDTGGFIQGGDLTQLRAPEDGLYTVSTTLGLDAYASGSYFGALYLTTSGSSSKDTKSIPANKWPGFTVSYTTRLLKGGAAHVWFLHDLNSVNLSINYGASVAWLSMLRVG